MEITKINPCRELLQSGICRQAFNLNPIHFCQLVAWIRNPRLQASISSQHHQAFGIGIQPSCRVYRRDRNVVGQGGPPVSTGKLGQHTIWFVEQYEVTQTGQPLPKTLQKRSDSG